MLQFDRRSRCLARMAALPDPGLDQQIRRRKMLRVALPPGEVCIYASRCSSSLARDQVTGHKAHRMSAAIFAQAKTIDSLDHILPAEVSVSPGDALAFNDRMRIVVLVV